MGPGPKRAEEVVDTLLGLPPEEQSHYLDQACGADAPFRRLVEEMLRAHQQAGKLPGKEMDLAAEKPTVAALLRSEIPADRIGRYKLLQAIGEGGCGVVYMAEQTEPMKRRVALKVIKLGMDTRQVIARFEAERQALALMDHPHIARVLDGGVTDSGRPFFVMELVNGIPITRYCDERKASTRERLELFMQVCLAIEHAHQKAIIHRDIKPSNILVADHDGVALPKVIDFGIAKATAGQTLTNKTLFTAVEQFVGTPAYMSPEQAQLSGVDIDRRSDVYSLGVLLYELLAGRTPFDPGRLARAGFDEVRRIIREEDPLRPSTRLTTLDLKEQVAVARYRQCEPARLRGLIRGDLDWIAMKALEKDRNRRYGTAQSLAQDIQRHLRHEPVVARPPSAAYRVRKFARRKKAALLAAATLVCVMLLATFGALLVGSSLKSKQSGQGFADPAVRGIAVLPFRNVSPGQIESYLPDSLTSEMISVMGRVPGLHVSLAPAVLAAQPAAQAREMLAHFHVPLMVEASLNRQRGKVAISGRLIETASGAELVVTNYECAEGNVLGIPNDLALRIAERTLTNLPDLTISRVSTLPTRNSEAYDFYLRGRFELKLLFAPGVGTNTIPMLERAVALDQHFALAWAELSRAYIVKYFYTNPDEARELGRKAFDAFTRALDLEPGLPEAHFAKAYYYWTPSQHWQVDKAIPEGREALRLNPNLRDVIDLLSLIYLHSGLFDEQADLALLANEIDPLNPGTEYLKANRLLWLGKNAEAVDLWRAVPDELGINFVMNSYLAVALINLGRTNEATDVIERALRTDARDIGGLLASVQAILLARQGNQAGAAVKISEALARRNSFGHSHHTLYNIASAYALLNESEPALKYLREAAADGFPCYPLFQVDVNLANLRGGKDFDTFLAEQKNVYQITKARFAMGHSLANATASGSRQPLKESRP